MARENHLPRRPEQPGFPPQVLREYAIVGDGRRGALVGPHGDIGWLCAPTWDSDAVFASLLGGRGVYAVTPADPRFVWGGFYQPGSLIWTNRWTTAAAILHCREALALPADPHRTVLLRRIEAIQGDAEVLVILGPRGRFGRRKPTGLKRDHGTWHARIGSLRLRWTGGAAAQPDGGTLVARLRIPAGSHHDLVLELSDQNLDTPVPDPDQAWRTTEHVWQRENRDLPDCPGHRDADHALAILRGLTNPDGGMVAAATTSLPERAKAARNYDYRYAWIRDQCFAGQAAAAAQVDSLLDAAVAFVSARLLEDGPRMAPAYTSTGARVPSEQPLDFLPGYPGGRVMTGNHVNDQFQLDAFGEALLLLATAARRDRIDHDSWRAIETAAHSIQSRWQEPDAGIWELEPRQWTHSKLICVAGLAAVARVAPARQAAPWASLADTILADTARHGLHPSGRWQRAADDPRIDAALLLPALRGALPPDDPRTTATLSAVRAELQRDGYVYRFRPDDRPLGDAEGAFLLCGLSTALAAHQAGDPIAAAHLFERNRAASGPPGLYSEEYDVQQRQLRGNLPQAFVHALLLETAVTLTTPAAGPPTAR